jgi:hypothetical protein
MVVFAAGYLAACTEVVDVTTDSRYAQYNRSTDWAKNEAILLNIARASEYQPLNFLIYNAYSGSATVSAAASSPAFVEGPYRTAAQKQFSYGSGALTGSAMANGSISVQNLDTQDFYDALLSPVDYTNLYAFQRQGYPRELLFRLFTDYVSMKPLNGTQSPYSFIVYNDPKREKQCVDVPAEISRQLYGHPLDPDGDKICFQDLVKFALLSGLSSEVRPIAAASSTGGAQPAAAAKPAAAPASSPSATAPKSPTSEGRLCFDDALANRAQAEYEKVFQVKLPPALKSAHYYPACGSTWSSPSSTKKGVQSGANTSSGAQQLRVEVTSNIKTGILVWDIHTLGIPHSIEIGTRSTFSIYNFLGKLVRDQKNSDSDRFNINKMVDPMADDPYVLTVNKGQPVGCFVSAVFDLGIYCVPIDGAQDTKRTFSILSQLLALKTTTGDLQIQPILRLLPQ